MSTWAQSMVLWGWQALVLVGVTFIAAKFSGCGSAAARHRLWLIGILAIAVLPLANATIRIPRVLPHAMETARPISPAAEETRSRTEEAQPIQDSTPRVVSWRSAAISLLFGFWIIGMGCSLYFSARSYWRVSQLRRAAQVVERGAFGIPVGYTSQLQTPILAGLWRPIILLPTDIGNWATEEEQRAIVLHERAHLERGDHLVNVIQAFVGAVLFFHPAVRYAMRQLVLERELACDERVLAAGANPPAYVEVILKVAERSIARADYRLAFSSPAKILERRMQMVLHYRPSTAATPRVVRLARTAAVLVPVLLLLPQQAVPLEVHSAAERQGAAPANPHPMQGAEATPGTVPQVRSLTPRPVQKTKAQTRVAPPRVVLAAPPVASPPVQGQTGTLTGTIFDQTGAVIPGAGVTVSSVGEVTGLGAAIVNAESGKSRSVVSNSRGVFELAGLPPGTYVLEVSLPGFATHRRRFTVGSGGITRDVTLQPAGSAISVQVSVEAPSAAADRPPDRTTPLRVGGVVSQPNLIYAPKPAYPALARARHIQDYVVLQAVISPEGLVASLRPDTSQGSGNMDLVQAAMDAVRQWRFRPALLNGQPIEWTTSVTVNFTLVD